MTICNLGISWPRVSFSVVYRPWWNFLSLICQTISWSNFLNSSKVLASRVSSSNKFYNGPVHSMKYYTLLFVLTYWKLISFDASLSLCEEQWLITPRMVKISQSTLISPFSSFFLPPPSILISVIQKLTQTMIYPYLSYLLTCLVSLLSPLLCTFPILLFPVWDVWLDLLLWLRRGCTMFCVCSWVLLLIPSTLLIF